jgi:Domain of unknown function (DUF4123)
MDNTHPLYELAKRDSDNETRVLSRQDVRQTMLHAEFCQWCATQPHMLYALTDNAMLPDMIEKLTAALRPVHAKSQPLSLAGEQADNQTASQSSGKVAADMPSPMKADPQSDQAADSEPPESPSQTTQQLRVVSLLDRALGHNHLTFAPSLIALPSSESTRNRVLQVLAACAVHTPAVSLMSSPLDLYALGRRLQLRSDVKLASMNDVMLLRFADMRVLPALLVTLDTLQRNAFCSFAHAWLGVDRSGRSMAIDISFALQEPMDAVLSLDQQQEDALLDTTLPDHIAAALNHAHPGALDKLPVEQRVPFVGAQIAQARLHGLHTGDDLQDWCMIALDRGTDFHDHPPWRSALHQVKSGQRSFRQALTKLL